jgi:16S rRNA (cytosine967-C5)-methyltransferase
MNSKIARRQAEICIKLVQDLDRAVVEEKQPADQALARFYRKHREYGARDRRFLSNAVFSWFRWRGWLQKPEKENIAFTILLDAIEIPPQLEYFGLNLTGRELKPAGHLTLEEKAEYLDHELRRRGKDAAALPFHEIHHGRARASGPAVLSGSLYLDLVPAWFPDFVFIPEQKDSNLHLRQCIESFQSRPPTWLRLPADREDNSLHLLADAGYEVERHPFLKQAVFMKGGQSIDAGKFPEIQVQDITSQCIGLCCAPQPGEHWWDMCAGSGGKSLHLADLMQGKGNILATDIRPTILSQLEKRLRQNEYKSIQPLLWDGAGVPSPRSSRPEGRPSPTKNDFDGVLVDAPCSGLGTWHRNPDARWRIEAKQIAGYARVQKDLLEIAAKKVKPGGKMVYSTCTLTKLENVNVIQSFLEKHPEFKLETTLNPLSRKLTNGLIWLWPWEGNCNGMFIAIMKKLFQNKHNVDRQITGR